MIWFQITTRVACSRGPAPPGPTTPSRWSGTVPTPAAAGTGSSRTRGATGGYVRMERRVQAREGLCGIASMPYYPVMRAHDIANPWMEYITNAMKS